MFRSRSRTSHLLLVSASLTLGLLAPPGRAQDSPLGQQGSVWNLGRQETGSTHPTTVTASNINCRGAHSFSISIEGRAARFLRITGPTVLTGIRKGESKTTDAVLDLRGIEAGNHDGGTVVVRCLDCAARCRPHETTLTVLLTVTGPDFATDEGEGSGEAIDVDELDTGPLIEEEGPFVTGEGPIITSPGSIRRGVDPLPRAGGPERSEEPGDDVPRSSPRGPVIVVEPHVDDECEGTVAPRQLTLDFVHETWGVETTEGGATGVSGERGSILDYLEDRTPGVGDFENDGEEAARRMGEAYLEFMRGNDDPNSDAFDRALLEDLEEFGREWDDAHDGATPTSGENEGEPEDGTFSPWSGTPPPSLREALDLGDLPASVPPPGSEIGPLSDRVRLGLSAAFFDAASNAEGATERVIFWGLYNWATDEDAEDLPTPILDADAREVLLDALYLEFWELYPAARAADFEGPAGRDWEQFGQVYQHFFYTPEQLASFDRKTDLMQEWSDRIVTVVHRQNAPDQIFRRQQAAKYWDGKSQSWRSLFFTGRAVDETHNRIVRFREAGIWANLAMQTTTVMLARQDLTDEDREVLLGLLERYTLARTLAAENIAAELKIVAEGVIADFTIWFAAPQVVTEGVGYLFGSARAALGLEAAGATEAAAAGEAAAAATARAEIEAARQAARARLANAVDDAPSWEPAARYSEEWLASAREYAREAAKRLAGEGASAEELAALEQKTLERLLRAPEGGDLPAPTAEQARAIEEFFHEIVMKSLFRSAEADAAAASGAAGAGRSAGALGEATAELTQLESQIGGASTALAESTAELTALESQIGGASGALGEATAELTQLESQIGGSAATGGVATSEAEALLPFLRTALSQGGRLPREVIQAGTLARMGRTPMEIYRLLRITPGALHDALIVYVRSSGFSAGEAIRIVNRFFAQTTPALAVGAALGASAAASAEAAEDESAGAGDADDDHFESPSAPPSTSMRDAPSDQTPASAMRSSGALLPGALPVKATSRTLEAGRLIEETPQRVTLHVVDAEDPPLGPGPDDGFDADPFVLSLDEGEGLVPFPVQVASLEPLYQDDEDDLSPLGVPFVNPYGRPDWPSDDDERPDRGEHPDPLGSAGGRAAGSATEGGAPTPGRPAAHAPHGVAGSRGEDELRSADSGGGSGDAGAGDDGNRSASPTVLPAELAGLDWTRSLVLPSVRRPIPVDVTPREGRFLHLMSTSDGVDGLHPALRVLTTDEIDLGDRRLVVLSYPRYLAPDVDRWLGASAGVALAEEDPCRKEHAAPNDPYFSSVGSWGQPDADQWAIRRVGFTAGVDTAWSAIANGGAPVTVAVIDTGLDWNHREIDWDHLWKNPGELPDNGIDDDGNGYVDDVIGWDFVRGDNRPWDRSGHGTFVTGVIAATSGNAEGIAGINPYARIMVLKAMNDFGETRASRVVRAIAYAADHGARVINLSLGGPRPTLAEQLAIDYAHSKGAVVVVAAGNEAEEIVDHAPAGLANTLTVAATGVDDRRAPFSNWGEAVDLAAPGVDVLSLRARRTDMLLGLPGVEYAARAAYVGDDRRYYRAAGTSFAAPIVSGTASLLLSLRPDLTNVEVERILRHSARDVGVPGVDRFTGYGLLDARAAVRADPKFFVDARIGGVDLVRGENGLLLRVRGTADADELAGAWLEIGPGSEPAQWTPASRRLEAPVRDGVLAQIAADELRGREWTLRLVTAHENGRQRESRITLDLP